MSSQPVDELDLQIIAALQTDGRVPWRTVAAALGEQERTVARRGTRLLESGVVRVSGMAIRGQPLLMRARCASGTARMTAKALANREDTTFSFLLAGASDCAAELFCSPAELNTVLLDDLPALPGMKSYETLPVLHYLRAIHEWCPIDLPASAVDALGGSPAPTSPIDAQHPPDSPIDRAILRALRENGRVTHEELARVAGVSASTARRRVESMRTVGNLFVRSVVNPAMLGFTVRAMLWVRTAPQQVQPAGRALLRSPNVRYAAVVGGRCQLAVEVALRDRASLYEFITDAAWLEHVDSIETTLVVRALKSGGMKAPEPQDVRLPRA